MGIDAHMKDTIFIQCSPADNRSPSQTTQAKHANVQSRARGRVWPQGVCLHVVVNALRSVQARLMRRDVAWHVREIERKEGGRGDFDDVAEPPKRVKEVFSSRRRRHMASSYVGLSVGDSSAVVAICKVCIQRVDGIYCSA